MDSIDTSFNRVLNKIYPINAVLLYLEQYFIETISLIKHVSVRLEQTQIVLYRHNSSLTQEESFQLNAY